MASCVADSKRCFAPRSACSVCISGKLDAGVFITEQSSAVQVRVAWDASSLSDTVGLFLRAAAQLDQADDASRRDWCKNRSEGGAECAGGWKRVPGAAGWLKNLHARGWPMESWSRPALSQRFPQRVGASRRDAALVMVAVVSANGKAARSIFRVIGLGTPCRRLSFGGRFRTVLPVNNRNPSAPVKSLLLKIRTWLTGRKGIFGELHGPFLRATSC